MASSAQLKIIIDAATGGAESALGSLDSKLSGLGKFGKVAAIGLGAAAAGAAVVGTAALAAGGMIAKLTVEAAAVEQTRKTFDNLSESIGSTADVLLSDLRFATRGMVSDADLMQGANKLVAMGLADTAEKAAQLAEMGSQLAIAMGKDAVSGMEEWALLLANQSIPRLHTFGISAGQARLRIAELMEANKDLTREQAFMQATLELGGAVMEKVGEQGVGAAADLARLGATFDNIKLSIGTAFLPALQEVAGALNAFLIENEAAIAGFAKSAGDWLGVKLPIALDGLKNWFTNTLPILKTQIGEMKSQWSGLVATWKQELANFGAAWSTVTTAVSAAMASIQAQVSAGMAGIGAAVVGGMAMVSAQFSAAWVSVQAAVLTAMASIRSAILSGMIAVASAVVSGMASVRAAFTSGMAAARAAVTSAMAAVRSAFSSGMAAARAAVQAGMNAVKAAFVSGMNAARAAVTSAMARIRGVVQAGMNAVKSAISSASSVVRGLGSAFSSVAGAVAAAVGRIVSAAQRAASALQNIKTPAALTGHSPSPFETTLVNVGTLMREMSRQTIPEFNAALGGTGPSQSNSYYYTLNVHSNASTEPIAADFMVLEALAGA